MAGNIPVEEFARGRGGGPRVSVLVGGYIDSALRQAIVRGESSRLDVLEMEARFGWRILDFSWLQGQERIHRSLWIIGPIAKRTLGWSWWLAVNASWVTRHDDALYCTGEDVSLPAGLLRRLGRRRRPRLVARIEQVSIGGRHWKRWAYQQLFRFAYGAHDRLLCRTRAQIDELAELGLETAKATFLPESTDTRFFSPGEPSHTAEASGYVPQDRYILSAGLELRDYETLVEATRDIGMTVVIAAKSPWSKFDSCLSDERARAHVVVGAFSRAELRELYRRAALVVVPVKPTPRACGMNVVLEAWSTARPVIASDTAGLRSYVDDGRTGLLVTPADATALRSRIVEALSDTVAAEQIAARAHARAKRCHSVDRYVGEVYEAISAALRPSSD